ncbi:hypothetical protein Tco_1529389 [Tanacetum coccineum]
MSARLSSDATFSMEMFSFWTLSRRKWIMARKEAPMGFRSRDGKDLRPADLLLFNWLQGKDACLDMTGISLFAGMGTNSWAPTVALLMRWKRKRRSMRQYVRTTDTSSSHLLSLRLGNLIRMLWTHFYVSSLFLLVTPIMLKVANLFFIE